MSSKGKGFLAVPHLREQQAPRAGKPGALARDYQAVGVGCAQLSFFRAIQAAAMVPKPTAVTIMPAEK